MPVDRFSRLTLGTNLTGTDLGDGELQLDASGGAGISDTIMDAKGDLISATAADTPARLAVGSNAQVLTADSAEATGLKWATPSAGAAGAITLLHTLTLGSAGTFDQSSISGSYNDLILVMIARGARSSAVDDIQLRLNNDSAGNYYRQHHYSVGTSVTANQGQGQTSVTTTGGGIPAASAPANSFGVYQCTLFGYASTTWVKSMLYEAYELADTGASGMVNLRGGGTWNSTAAITRIQIQGSVTANLVTGSQLRIYGRL